MSDTVNSQRRRVMVIGLDGATFDLIRPWIENGTMPTLQRLIASGASGVLPGMKKDVFIFLMISEKSFSVIHRCGNRLYQLSYVLLDKRGVL